MTPPFRREPNALRHFPVTAVAGDSSTLSGWEGFVGKLGQIAEGKIYERQNSASPGDAW